MDVGWTQSAHRGTTFEVWETHTFSMLLIALWSLVLLGALALNATLLVAFVRNSALRDISNRFVMNLIGSNILSTLVLTGLLLTNAIGLSFEHTAIQSSVGSVPNACSLAEGAVSLVTTSSVLSVVLIAWDQYSAVVDPLRYRTRIGKVKCGLLILAVWIISLLLGVWAIFNPEPQTLCALLSSKTTTTTTSKSSATMELSKNSLAKLGNVFGIVYASTYVLLVFLVPFIAICCFYAKIYMAARNNSERTRRTGSRPILSSGSFSEESGYNHGTRMEASYEDVRSARLPKISSLSSIDERSEATPSQLAYQDNLDEELQEVVFTLGKKKIEHKQDCPTAISTEPQQQPQQQSPKVPIAALKAQFLSNDLVQQQIRCNSAELVRSKFPEVCEQRRKSSHDLLYENSLLVDPKHPYEYEDEEEGDDGDDDDDLGESSDEENDRMVDRSNVPRNSDSIDLEEALPLSIEMPHGFQSKGAELGDQSSTSTSSSQAQHQHQQQAPPIVTITPPAQRAASGNLHRVPSSSKPISMTSQCGYIQNIKHKISNGSLFKYREETRAARISAFVIVMAFICWTPYSLLLLVRNLPMPAQIARFLDPPKILGAPSLELLALTFFVLATYLSPLLFGYRSKKVKRELHKFFCFKRELSYKNNRSLMAKKVLKRRHSGATILGQFVEHQSGNVEGSRYNIFGCIGSSSRTNGKWPKDKVHFVQVPDTALTVETCRSSFSSGASTQISSTSTDEC
ncbi:uncharacterized protein LOC106659192 [Trichogramma pretiosum]|uniref:uncharacterized protein LOC106659192 n=1 Tax=Trichogramma pretiosum TaxID=7493 RepID=UPI0006C97A16|nr:uncharacterized protein LOC106659192 [Trichogramma pretiosum]